MRTEQNSALCENPANEPAPTARKSAAKELDARNLAFLAALDEERRSVAEARADAVRDYEAGRCSAVEAASRLKLSRPRFYALAARWKETGSVADLLPHGAERQLRASPRTAGFGPQIDAAIEQLVRGTGPFNGEALTDALEAAGLPLPAKSSIFAAVARASHNVRDGSRLLPAWARRPLCEAIDGKAPVFGTATVLDEVTVRTRAGPATVTLVLDVVGRHVLGWAPLGGMEGRRLALADAARSWRAPSIRGAADLPVPMLIAIEGDGITWHELAEVIRNSGFDLISRPARGRNVGRLAIALLGGRLQSLPLGLAGTVTAAPNARPEITEALKRYQMAHDLWLGVQGYDVSNRSATPAEIALEGALDQLGERLAGR